MEFAMKETVRNRYSVRTYGKKPLAAEIKVMLEDYISKLSNPFSAHVAFCLLESKAAVNGAKLGTYGMIKGASDYFGATVAPSDLALEGLGYEFENLVLYCASLGLGTCWLGGTFTRSEFAKAMSVNSTDLFPAISPVGYAADKKRLSELLMRKMIKADQRKPWEEIFFNSGFSSPLSEALAGAYAYPLEMVRLAPSASNKQPWRIVKKENDYHFYKSASPGYSDRLGFDIQKIDLGIAACHFHLAAEEKELTGRFEVLQAPAVNTPEHTHYVFSWIGESANWR